MASEMYTALSRTFQRNEPNWEIHVSTRTTLANPKPYYITTGSRIFLIRMNIREFKCIAPMHGQ